MTTHHFTSKSLFLGLWLIAPLGCDPAESGDPNPSAIGGTGGQGGAAMATGGSLSALGGAASNPGQGGASLGAGGARSFGGMVGRGGASFGGAAAEGTPVALHGALHVSGTKLVDAHETAVQLKGPSSMWLNWENTGYAKDPAGVAFLRDDWKATVIRAAMGVEPAGAYLSDPNRANQAVRDVIDNAINLGMYVIIDWHDHNAQLHQAEAIQFFQQIAAEYGQYPNILYETFNEPLQVSWDSVIKPYHEAVVQAIRAVDPDNVIILGSPQWDQDLKSPAKNPVAGTNLMYALHFYACSHGKWLRDAGDAAIAQNLALFVSEWGATHADGGTAKNPTLCLDEAQAFHDWMNLNQIGWAAWKFDDCVDQTCYFPSKTPTTGSWTDSQLNGHAPFVRDRMRE